MKSPGFKMKKKKITTTDLTNIGHDYINQLDYFPDFAKTKAHSIWGHFVMLFLDFTGQIELTYRRTLDNADELKIDEEKKLKKLYAEKHQGEKHGKNR